MNLIALTMAAFAAHLMVGCDRSTPDTGSPSTGEPAPLAYTVHKADGVTLATFDGWETTARSDDKGTTIRSHPRGRKDEFTLVLYIAPMNDRDQATYLDETPASMGGLDSTRIKTGRVIRRGANLTFHYDDGSVRTSDYALQGDALQLHGKRWERR